MVLSWHRSNGGQTPDDTDEAAAEAELALKADWEFAATCNGPRLSGFELIRALNKFKPVSERSGLAATADNLLLDVHDVQLPADTRYPSAIDFGLGVMATGELWTVDQVAELLARMNNDHAVVSLGNSVRYLSKTGDASGQPAMRFLAEADMNALYAPINIQAGAGKAVSAFALWKRWAKRRHYENIGLFPPPLEAPKGYLNLWVGFAVQPVPGDWSLLRNHIKNAVCGGDEAHFTWVMDWLAQLVQEPGKKTGTALVLKSDAKGTGKTVINVMLKRIFGVHAIGVSKSDQFVGRFNGHLKHVIVLGVEEGFWAGDKQGEGALKNLITEPTITIEQKGIDAFDIDNFTRLIFTSNSDWVVPAAIDERRYMALEVRNERAKDKTYFDPLFDQMLKAGGAEAMLHELLHRQIESDLRNPPETDELKKQRTLSLTGLRRWLLTMARDGEFSDPLGGPPIGLDEFKGSTIRCRAVIDAAKKALNQHEGRDVDTRLGELLKSVGVARVRQTKGDRPWVYSFPPLHEFQANVERVLKVPCRPTASEPAGDLVGATGARAARQPIDANAAARAWGKRDKVRSDRARLDGLAVRLAAAKPALPPLAHPG